MKQTETPMYKNVATACSVVVLAFGLAACSSSSNKTAAPADPPPKVDAELQQQRDAAKAAEDAAKAASDLAAQGMAAADDDPAKIGSDEAQTAVMNLVSVQLATKAKMYADEAKAAADAAKKAYDTAKAESAKAAATTSVVAATEAKRAAEAARKEAEAQAAIANAKAKQAVDAAKMGIKYADGTYTVGATSIMSGAPKAETGTGEQKVTTGTQEIEEDAHTARTAITYQADPERLAQPEIEARKLPVGVDIDSKDDTARLRIIDKYVGSKDVFIYVPAGEGGPDPEETDHDVSNDLPYGALDLTDAVTTTSYPKLKVHRAGGEFYKLMQEDWNNLNDETSGVMVSNNKIEMDTKDSNADTEENKNKEIYYVIAPVAGNFLGLTRAKGDRIYLKRDSVGAEKITYGAISVRGDVKFPAEMAYEHMNYGTWVTLKEVSGGDNEDPDGLGIPFVRTLTSMTTDMPTSGHAVYDGHWVGQVRSADADGEGMIRSYTGGSETAVNFVTNGIHVTLSTSSNVDDPDTPAAFARLEGAIAGNGFAGTKATVLLATNVGSKSGDDPVTLETTGEYTGTVSGNFYGPMAVEVGGIFDFTSADKKQGEFRGAFGGRKQ